MGSISSGNNIDEIIAKINSIESYDDQNFVSEVSTKKIIYQRNNNSKFNIALLDLGVKNNIIRLLESRNCSVKIFPYTSTSKDILSSNPDGKNPGDIWVFRNVKHNHEEQTIHPCQFPEDLIGRIILSTTKENDVVYDPYMGTGTTAVVAKEFNRNFIGTEIDTKYMKTANLRLKKKTLF